MSIRKVKLSKLVFDFNFYPRHNVDPWHINQIAEALRAGKVMPPIVVDQKSNRVIDGFHRVEAYRKVFGDNASIQAEFKSYKSDADMLLDAVSANINHGRALDPRDKVRCIVLLESSGLPIDRIASALNMTTGKAEELKAERTAEYKLSTVALKGSTDHFAQLKLTKQQSEYNEKAGGLRQLFYVNQVVLMLELDTVDWSNNNLVAGLTKLAKLLDSKLVTSKGK